VQSRRRIEEAGNRLHNVTSELDLKMSMAEGKKIIEMFKNYAMYTELKELH
jgi:hypothetical protein